MGSSRRGPTHAQGEHANSTKKGPNQVVDSNPELSCCEAVVQTTVPPWLVLFYFPVVFNYVFYRCLVQAHFPACQQLTWPHHPRQVMHRWFFGGLHINMVVRTRLHRTVHTQYSESWSRGACWLYTWGSEWGHAEICSVWCKDFSVYLDPLVVLSCSGNVNISHYTVFIHGADTCAKF